MAEKEIDHLKAQIEALQMDNKQLQSDVIIANQNYEHINELWNAEKERGNRINERFLNTYEKLKKSASHNANLESELEAQRFSLAVHKEEIEKLQAAIEMLKKHNDFLESEIEKVKEKLME